LLIAMPLIGWSMLSAGGYPIVLYGSIHLPKIMPHNDELYAFLRSAHTILALLFFATILLHVGAALFHALIRQDGVQGPQLAHPVIGSIFKGGNGSI
jgi:cytochrome b561